MNSDSSFDILYDDGDSEQRIHPRNVRKLDESPVNSDEDSLNVGDNVEARYRGGSKWSPATILRAHPEGTYDVEYNDNSEIERRLNSRFVRRTVNASPIRDELKKGDRVNSKFKGSLKKFPHSSFICKNICNLYDSLI